MKVTVIAETPNPMDVIGIAAGIEEGWNNDEQRP